VRRLWPRLFPKFLPSVLLEFKPSMISLRPFSSVPEGTAVRRGQWVWVPKRDRVPPPEGERATIIAACDKFVAEVLKPRFLPSILPTEFNYPIDLYGKWHGGRYRFLNGSARTRPMQSNLSSSILSPVWITLRPIDSM
jgi:hypothetical protein